MKRLHFGIVVLVIALLALAACAPQEAPTAVPPTPEPEEVGVIVLGDIDQDNPIEKIKEFQPIIDYVAGQLGDFGIGKGEVRIAPDLDSMMTMIKNGEVNLFYDSLYPAMIIAEETGAEPLLRGWRGGEPVYHSVFFALADNNITDLTDLNGKMIAYDDRASTSGFMMPTSYLITNGLNPVEKDSYGSSVTDDEVGYVFSASDDNTIEWVISGLVDVGVVDNLTFLSDIPEETRDQLTIIAETQDVPRRVLMVGPDADPEMVSAVVEILVGMDDSDEGLELLDIIKTAKFDEFPDGIEAAFAPIQEMYNVIKEE